MTNTNEVTASTQNLKKSAPLLKQLGKALQDGNSQEVSPLLKKLQKAVLQDIPERTSPTTGKKVQSVSADYSDEGYHPRDPRPFNGLAQLFIQVGRPNKYFYTYNIFVHVGKDLSLTMHVSQFANPIWRKDVKQAAAERTIEEFIRLFDSTGFLMGKKKGEPGYPRFN